ncbi:hypothetical protein Riv7116_2036 [Rivularia sp. PCC 7116]|uniref:hypothetical protein n=1 Tax=Rivularia sp. PCC 7116 TaxID=373994 RepID=UPI00029ECE58|nr:hypothetical protein [Rivularia sp. PCC 7116]AFY54571.1 hypothetical protein Riv7116_2036 [Rivularia sp. PCC 7116]
MNRLKLVEFQYIVFATANYGLIVLNRKQLLDACSRVTQTALKVYVNLRGESFFSTAVHKVVESKAHKKFGLELNKIANPNIGIWIIWSFHSSH